MPLFSELDFGVRFRFTAKAVEDFNSRIVNTDRAQLVDAYSLSVDQVFISANIPTIAGPYLAPIQETNIRFFNRWVSNCPTQLLEVEVLESAPKPLRNTPFLTRHAFTTSCDPEVFLENPEGRIIPAFQVLPSQKRAIDVPGYGTAYEDGFQAEFSPAPRACHQEVLNGIRFTLSRIVEHIPGYEKNWRFSTKNVVMLSPTELASGTASQVSLGCQPSENIYGTSSFSADGATFPFRMAGGHIHLGKREVAKHLHKNAALVIAAMDAFCGVASVAAFDGMEDTRRRQFYGRAGEFRYQPHGLEYRTLSNAWLYSPYFFHIIFNLARGAFRFGLMNRPEMEKVDQLAVREIIDGYDVAGAKKFMLQHARLFRYILMGEDLTGKAATFAMLKVNEGFAKKRPRWAEFGYEWREFLQGGSFRKYETAGRAKRAQPPDFGRIVNPPPSRELYVPDETASLVSQAA